MIRRGLLRANEPDFWKDEAGFTRRVSQSNGKKWKGNVALKAFIMRRDGYTCNHCGSMEMNDLVVDHIISRANGGSHHPRNLQVLCWSCNSRKAGAVDKNRKWRTKSPQT